MSGRLTALGLIAPDGDPGWLLVWIITAVVVALVAAVTVLCLLRLRGVRRFAVVEPAVRANREAIGELGGVVRDIRSVMRDAFSETGQPVPGALACKRPDLHMIKGGRAS